MDPMVAWDIYEGVQNVKLLLCRLHFFGEQLCRLRSFPAQKNHQTSGYFFASPFGELFRRFFRSPIHSHPTCPNASTNFRTNFIPYIFLKRKSHAFLKVYELTTRPAERFPEPTRPKLGCQETYIAPPQQLDRKEGIHFPKQKTTGTLRRICPTDPTVDGRNPAPVEVGSLSHYYLSLSIMIFKVFYIPSGERRISGIPKNLHHTTYDKTCGFKSPLSHT